jgi:hypothetical protein
MVQYILKGSNDGVKCSKLQDLGCYPSSSIVKITEYIVLETGSVPSCSFGALIKIPPQLLICIQ